MQKRTDFFDNSLSRIVPDIPLVIRNKPHNNQLCADLSRLISAYPVVSHFLRFAWQTTEIRQGVFLSDLFLYAFKIPFGSILESCTFFILLVAVKAKLSGIIGNRVIFKSGKFS